MKLENVIVGETYKVKDLLAPINGNRRASLLTSKTVTVLYKESLEYEGDWTVKVTTQEYEGYFWINHSWIKKIKKPKLTRFEVITPKGRDFVYNGNPFTVEESLQDEGRTLKIFIKECIDNE